MKIHAISTGQVKITQSWQVGRNRDSLRLAHALADRRFTDWLPIFCYVVEHPEGLIVIDTGIPANANDPVWFPPWMRLVQQAAFFDQMTAEQEIGPQLQQRGLSAKDVRWVLMTHLHQDHDGGLQHFRGAEIVIARAEWEAATGLRGRLGGYLNQRWPTWLEPHLIDFEAGPHHGFASSYSVTRQGDVRLVPTPGHSAGHASILLEDDGHVVCFAGDASYSQELLLRDAIDGIGPDPIAEHDSHQQLLRLARETPTVYLPTHEWDAERRLAQREPVPAASLASLPAKELSHA